jgi:hypothetical protein
MYTFSSKLKTFSFVLMIVGILGIGYGFLTAPKTIQEVETILKEEEAHHEGGHEAALPTPLHIIHSSHNCRALPLRGFPTPTSAG